MCFQLLSRHPPFSFINLFINLRGSEGVGYVGSLEIDIALVHLHRGVTARFHRYVHGDPLACPLREGGVSQVVKNEFLDARLPERLFYLIVYQPLGDLRAIVQGEHEPAQIRHYGAAFLVGLDLLVNLPRPVSQRRDLLNAALLAAAFRLDGALALIDHAVSEPQEIALRQTSLFAELP